MSAPAESVLRRPVLKPSAELPQMRVFLPEPGNPANGPLSAGREATFCIVEDGATERQVRFKGDPHLWEWPGVYEHLVRDLLRGNAPAAVCRLLERAIRASGERPETLRAIDLVAGNGWVGQELNAIGINEIIGIDASAAAAAAAERDHPGAHSEFRVLDIRRLSEAQRDELMGFDFNSLICIEPLAVEEPPPNAFTEAFNLLAPDGWVAFHLHAGSAEGGRDSRFAHTVHRMIRSRALHVHTQQRYRHRFTTHGSPLFHVAVIGRKTRDFEPGEPS
ncbi:MAG: class I SAM-dependent methyltransferase [bacterium]|nr:class I SAM-dependent methyltransferase [bacterium]